MVLFTRMFRVATAIITGASVAYVGYGKLIANGKKHNQETDLTENKTAGMLPIESTVGASSNHLLAHVVESALPTTADDDMSSLMNIVSAFVQAATDLSEARNEIIHPEEEAELEPSKVRQYQAEGLLERAVSTFATKVIPAVSKAKRLLQFKFRQLLSLSSHVPLTLTFEVVVTLMLFLSNRVRNHGALPDTTSVEPSNEPFRGLTEELQQSIEELKQQLDAQFSSSDSLAKKLQRRYDAQQEKYLEKSRELEHEKTKSEQAFAEAAQNFQMMGKALSEQIEKLETKYRELHDTLQEIKQEAWHKEVSYQQSINTQLQSAMNSTQEVAQTVETLERDFKITKAEMDTKCCAEKKNQRLATARDERLEAVTSGLQEEIKQFERKFNKLKTEMTGKDKEILQKEVNIENTENSKPTPGQIPAHLDLKELELARAHEETAEVKARNKGLVDQIFELRKENGRLRTEGSSNTDGNTSQRTLQEASIVVTPQTEVQPPYLATDPETISANRAQSATGHALSTAQVVAENQAQPARSPNLSNSKYAGSAGLPVVRGPRAKRSVTTARSSGTNPATRVLLDGDKPKQIINAVQPATAVTSDEAKGSTSKYDWRLDHSLSQDQKMMLAMGKSLEEVLGKQAAAEKQGIKTTDADGWPQTGNSHGRVISASENSPLQPPRLGVESGTDSKTYREASDSRKCINWTNRPETPDNPDVCSVDEPQGFFQPPIAPRSMRMQQAGRTTDRQIITLPPLLEPRYAATADEVPAYFRRIRGTQDAYRTSDPAQRLKQWNRQQYNITRKLNCSNGHHSRDTNPPVDMPWLGRPRPAMMPACHSEDGREGLQLSRTDSLLRQQAQEPEDLLDLS